MSTVRIHALASLPHYRRHVEAVWKHLDPSMKGECRWGRSASTRNLPRTDVVMVGGFYDLDRVPENLVVYVEHGAGQAYHGDPDSSGMPAYHGSHHPDRVIGYICPNQRVAASWGRPAFVAGCPALDDIGMRLDSEEPKPRIAVITFHWDAVRVCPEARSARDHYVDYLHEMVWKLQRESFEVVGHAHPRDFRAAEIWRNLQVQFEPDPDWVLRNASILIADNTSLQYEAGKIGIRQVVLNAPWYRRYVDHGLRFWDYIPGEEVDSIEDFMKISFFERAMQARVIARRAGDHAFEGVVGQQGERAARWIEKLVGEQT